jgi:hypothetical protein
MNARSYPLSAMAIVTGVRPQIVKFIRDTAAENLIAGICLIFRGLNFSRNADIGQVGHLWMGTNWF